MSENLETPASDRPPARAILLVEQYGALGIAIAAALNRFAPFYALRVVQAWTDLEPAAEPMRPELFILDLDPPPGEEVKFLNRLRTRYPDARVLLIAAGICSDLRTERGTAAGLQFIEKPFELAEFGATVQALLASWTTPPTEEARGTLRDLDVIDLLQVKCLALNSGTVRLETGDGDIGEVHFHHGQIAHASAGDLTGVPALEEIVRLREGELSEGPLPENAPKTIEQPWGPLLLAAVRKAREHDPESLGRERARAVAPDPPMPPAKTILVIDDTEMLLIFASDVLGTANRSYRVLTAPTGSEGLELAATHRPDLILLDYSLTDINGDDVCRALLADEMTARIPVLMMSGHIPELANTAASCRNVVATLPKPFLSGALINEVEKILAAGPLAKTSSTAMAQPEAPPPSYPAATSANGRVAERDVQTERPGEEQSSPPVAIAVAAAEPETAAAPHSRPQSLEPEPMGEISTALPTEHREVTLTAPYDVVSVQLGTDFRMSALQLKPAQSTLMVRMDSGGGSAILPPDRDFVAGPVQLNADGMIASLRLLPTTRGVQAPLGGGDFAVGRVSTESEPDGHLHLSGSKSATMRVQLAATFQLMTVDLSQNFEVAGLVLQAQGNNILVQAGEYSALAMRFQIQEVELDDAGQLSGLIVRAAP